MSTTKKEPGVAAMIIVLSVICLVVAALLGIINGITAPLIAENNNRILDQLCCLSLCPQWSICLSAFGPALIFPDSLCVHNKRYLHIISLIS